MPKSSVAQGKQANTIAYILIIIIILIAFCTIIGIIMYFRKPQTQETQKHQHDLDKICMTKNEYEKLFSLTKTTCSSNFNTNERSDRDMRVLTDPLYPPLNRTNTPVHNALEQNINVRNMYVPTNDSMDNYRLIGYLVSKDNEKDAGGNNWKLFARQKDRNRSDFYMIPSNNNYDIKIHISDEIVNGSEKLRDMYTVPKTIMFVSPMLNKSEYEFVELPKSDLSSGTRYM